MDVGAAALAEALKTNTTLRQLDLRANEIGGGGALALGLMLGQNCTLRVLLLSTNNLGVTGAKQLVKSLNGGGSEGSDFKSGLEMLVLSHCKIGHVGGRAVCKALVGSSLKHLDLSSVDFHFLGVFRRHESLCCNPALCVCVYVRYVGVIECSVHRSRQSYCQTTSTLLPYHVKPVPRPPYLTFVLINWRRLAVARLAITLVFK
jgi:hypothetical protein